MAKRIKMDRVPEAPKFRVWGVDEVLYGPIDLLTLVDWVRQQRVTARCWVYHDQRNVWSRAGETEELLPLFDEAKRSAAADIISASRGGVNSDALERVRLLAGFTEQQLLAFLKYMEILSLEPYAYAVREGEPGDAIFLILEGELRVELFREGRQHILTTLYSGDFFGEVSLLDEGPRSADVVANERSTLLRISTMAFARLRREAPALAEPFLFALSRSVVGRLRLINKRYDGSVRMLQALNVT